ncbi:MFS transporter [Rhizobium mesosinicum]|uniref:MFS transporter n=2 Tax=Rhizobium mesosinicum TaxID=335017 RepID=A0ABS7GTZ6_9HYPH|nr:MFS transporter [Rhizobium mesosinicum]
MSTSPPLTAESGRMGAGAAGMLAVLCGAIFLEGVDAAMLNIALPSIRAELGLSTTTLSAVVSAYVLAYAGLMLLGGRVADIYGKRKVFLTALAVFLLFSGLGGFATEGWMLLTARFVTGAAAAFMTPAGLALISGSFPEGLQRNRAVLIYAGTASAGFSLGLVIGGLLSAVGWRWVFFAPVIVSAILLVAGLKLIVENKESIAPRQRFDIAGAVTLTGAMLLAAYTLTRLEHATGELSWTIATAGASAVLWLAFILIERTSRAPLMRLGIFRSASLVRSNLGAMLFTGAFFGFQFIVSLYLQELLGWSAFETSLALIVIGMDAILAPLLTPLLVERFGNGRVVLGGFAFAVAGYALFLGMGLDWTYAAMLPSTILLGLAFSLGYGPLTIIATEGIAENEQGLASGLVNTSFQFGAALGLSAVSAVGTLALGDGDSPSERLEALRTALLIPVAATAIGMIIMSFGRSRCADASCRLQAG